MSKHETPMVLWYWEQVGGTLIEEFTLVPASRGHGRRCVDALILPDEPRLRLPAGSTVDVRGKRVILVQAKDRRLGMSLMGQVLFSAELVRRLDPLSVESVALCRQDDDVLSALLEAHEGCKVVVARDAKRSSA